MALPGLSLCVRLGGGGRVRLLASHFKFGTTIRNTTFTHTGGQAIYLSRFGAHLKYAARESKLCNFPAKLDAEWRVDTVHVITGQFSDPPSKKTN
jgi:hypothetical protein